MRKEGTPYSIFYVADVVCKGFVTDRLYFFKLPQEKWANGCNQIPAENIGKPGTATSLPFNNIVCLQFCRMYRKRIKS